jgi:hypothetical protein
MRSCGSLGLGSIFFRRLVKWVSTARSVTKVSRPQTRSSNRFRLSIWLKSTPTSPEVTKLWAPPGLVYQERQVMDPIGFTNSARVDKMTEVVFGIRDNEIGMGN